jgi:hypothetical protein
MIKDKILKLATSQKPYTPEDMKQKTYVLKGHVEGIGWVEVQTTVQNLCNGMLEQADKKIQAGEYTKCGPPDPSETIIER